jgi:DNA modification methylase
MCSTPIFGSGTTLTAAERHGSAPVRGGIERGYIVKTAGN